MTNRLGIENLTLMGMPPVEYVTLAAELGCSGVSLGLTSMPFERFGFTGIDLYPNWSLIDDLELRRNLKSALADTGVQISLGEGFRVDPAFDVAEKASWLDIIAELGAKRINAVSMETDRGRTLAQLDKLADMAIERGMLFTIEFAPPNAINSLDDALSVTASLGLDRAKVLLDSMHFFRSGGHLDQLCELDMSLIGYAQIADSTWEPLKNKPYLMEATFGRAIPGEGEFPLADWVATLPADLHIGIEAPALGRFMAGLAPRDYARMAVEAARGLGA